MSKPGLYKNIHNKRARIKAQKASGRKVERMAGKNNPKRPTKADFVKSAKTAKKRKYA